MQVSPRTVTAIEDEIDGLLRELDRDSKPYEIIVNGTALAVYAHAPGWVEVKPEGVRLIMPTVTNEYIIGIKEL